MSSQDSVEIKTIEQWKWSEMQGLELVSDAPISHQYKANTPTTQEQEGAASAQDNRATKMDTYEEPNNDDPPSATSGVANGSSSSGGEKAESVPSVGFGELFRFADGLDYILMAIGTAGAIVHGCSLPLFLRFFADLVNSFGSNANNVDKMTQEVVKVIVL